MKRAIQRISITALALLMSVAISVFIIAVGPSVDAADDAGKDSYYRLDQHSPAVFYRDGKSVTCLPKIIITDTDGDGACTASDARGVLRIALDLDPYSGSLGFVDIDSDSLVTAADARLLLRSVLDIDKLYMTSSGKVPSGWYTDVTGGRRYFTEAGVLCFGLFSDSDGGVYYADDNGKLLTGLIRRDRTYMLRADGGVVNGMTDIDGSRYFFENNTAATGLKTVGSYTYLFDGDGRMQYGLRNIGPDTYFFAADGRMIMGWGDVDGARRYFDADGKMVRGLVDIDSSTYFFDQNGALFHGANKIDGVLYFFGSDGKMLRNEHAYVDGKEYVFDENGAGSLYRDPETLKIAMIGDSLVLNMNINNVTDRIDCYGKVSLHVYDMFSKSVSGSSRTVIDEVSGRGYDVVVILVGINDLGMSESAWAGYYRDVIRGVRQRAPGAQIIAHGLLPINETVAHRNGYTCTNAQIRSKNATIKSVADSEGIDYIDAAASVLDSSGTLPANAAGDGIHFMKAYAKKWADWLVYQICYEY